VGFSAFSDGGRFEALSNTEPREEETNSAGMGRDARVALVASFAEVRGVSGKGPGRGAEPARAAGLR
jgi:hypothetical protein